MPIRFENIDYVYNFPFEIEGVDSCYSNYNASIPSLGSLFHEQMRYNFFDGYGTLITPLDTFENAIRIKTLINSSDSIFIEQYSFPYKMNRIIEEYKWYAEGYRGCVAIASIQTGMGQNMSTFKYKTPPLQTTSIIENSMNVFTIYPNPANEYVVIDIDDNNLPYMCSIFDCFGRKIFAEERISLTKNKINLLDLHLSKGIYFVKVENGNFSKTQMLIIEN